MKIKRSVVSEQTVQWKLDKPGIMTIKKTNLDNLKCLNLSKKQLDIQFVKVW